MRKSKLIVHSLVFTFAVLMAFSSGGCAFGDRVVALDYDSSEYCSKSNQQLEIYIASILDASPNELKKVSFKDSKGTRVKQDGKKIGSVKNGYGIETASVVSKSTDLGLWLTHALSEELRGQCFNVVNVTSLPPRAGVGINGSINKCYSNMYFLKRPDCTIGATINLYKSDGKIFSKQYTGNSYVKWSVGSATEYETAFETAMKDLVKKVVADIKDSVDD